LNDLAEKDDLGLKNSRNEPFFLRISKKQFTLVFLVRLTGMKKAIFMPWIWEVLTSGSCVSISGAKVLA
jgi:hypothetical protein